MDTSNQKFDELLLIMEETFDCLKAQAPTADAYDKLSKKINNYFKRAFERSEDLKTDALLASQVRPSYVRWVEK